MATGIKRNGLTGEAAGLWLTDCAGKVQRQGLDMTLGLLEWLWVQRRTEQFLRDGLNPRYLQHHGMACPGVERGLKAEDSVPIGMYHVNGNVNGVGLIPFVPRGFM